MKLTVDVAEAVISPLLSDVTWTVTMPWPEADRSACGLRLTPSPPASRLRLRERARTRKFCHARGPSARDNCGPGPPGAVPAGMADSGFAAVRRTAMERLGGNPN